jgi:hypothetical protein
LVLATIAHFNGRCTRAQVLRVLELAGYSMRCKQQPLFSLLRYRLELINIEHNHDLNVFTFTDPQQQQLVRPDALAQVKELLESNE